jgi:hypothetical protein
MKNPGSNVWTMAMVSILSITPTPNHYIGYSAIEHELGAIKLDIDIVFIFKILISVRIISVKLIEHLVGEMFSVGFISLLS